MKRLYILGICLILVGSFPLIAGGREDLQPIYDFRGTTGGAQMGWNITGVGDINNDGREDYAMGSPGENKAYVFFAPFTATATPATANIRYSGPQGSDFGWDIQGVDDFDGDGRDDIIIGAPGEDKAYVFSGSRTGSVSYTSADFTISGTGGDMFGHSVCGINLDGNTGKFAVVGAPRNEHYIDPVGNFRTGAVFLFNLTAFREMGVSSIDSSTNSNFTYRGDQDNGWFGFTVRNSKDLNGDGIDDLGIGDPYYSPSGYNNKGGLYIQYGKNLIAEPPERISSSLDGLISGNNNSKFGWSAKGVGDIRGGPQGDLMVGAPFEGEGKAYLFFGASSSLNIDMTAGGTADNVFNGTNPADRFGWSFDLTMIADPTTFVLSIGAPGYDNGTSTDAGAVFSFWSWTSPASADDANSAFLGETQGENLGYSLCEVNFTMPAGGNTFGILTSSPFYGSSDQGRLKVLKRNRLPTIGGLTYGLSTGSESTIFDIRMEYTDPDNDPPLYMKVDFYYDSSGTQLAKSVDLSRIASDTDQFSEGVSYQALTTLPSSINMNDTNAPLYYRGYARAVRGSISVVYAGPINSGPVIDGVEPSAPDNLFWDDTPADEEKIPGTIKLFWDWPQENDGYPFNKAEKVKKMEIRFMAGNHTSSDFDWDSAIIYKSFEGTLEIKNPFQSDQMLLGTEGQIFTPRSWYSIAMRAWDEVDNVGSISEVVNAEAYWRRPDIPDPCTLVSVVDYKGEDGTGDDGGALKLDFAPPRMNEPSDIDVYRVYIFEENEYDIGSLGNVSDITWEPDLLITPDDEEAFYNHTLVLTHYHGGDLEDGKYYYVGVVPVNWLGQFAKGITWSDTAVKVVNDNLPPLPRIKGVDGVSLNGEGKIKVTWDTTNADRFVYYDIYGQSYPYSNLGNAEFLGRVAERSTGEFLVDSIGGNPIYQGTLYSFTVLVMDHNDHMDMKVDVGNNTVHGVKYIDPPGEIPNQIKGVSMSDVPNDGGGALTLSWFRSFASNFWQYNIYIDDEPITDISSMEPESVIRLQEKTDELIDSMDGKPLIDGVLYYAAVTIVNWDLTENTLIDGNNTDFAEPINQSDTTPPIFVVKNLRQEGEITNSAFTILWDPITKDDVLDFHHYLIRYSGGGKGIQEIIIEDINASSVLIDRLNRGTRYYLNISIVDDNGNIGPATTSLEVMTAGANQPPVVLWIVATVGEELNYLKNSTDELTVDLNEYKIIYFTGHADDDYTRESRLIFKFNITLPSGEYIEKSSYTFDLDLNDEGDYNVELYVVDQEGLESEPFGITIHAEKNVEKEAAPVWIWIVLLAVAIVIGIVVVLIVLLSGSKSQKKQKLEEYRQRRQDIEAMEPIYANLPTWTCDCGSTQVPIIEHAYCNTCYQSHEAVPIDGIDEYLKEHDLVLAEMKIDVPPGWQGQDFAMESAKKDLEERKKRALEALNEEYAPWLQGTEFEEEVNEMLKAKEEAEGGTAPPGALAPEGAIIPGQAPPPPPPQSGPIVPGQPQPIRPMPAGAPGQRPPMPQMGAPGPRPPAAPQPPRPPSGPQQQ